MRTAAYTYPARRADRTRVMLLIAAVAILAAAVAVALYIAVTAWGAAGAATTQNRQLRGQIASLKAADVGNNSSIKSVVSQFSAYSEICDQALVGQTGAPGVYYYPCSSTRP